MHTPDTNTQDIFNMNQKQPNEEMSRLKNGWIIACNERGRPGLKDDDSLVFCNLNHISL